MGCQCKSCFEKWTNFYVKKGFPEKAPFLFFWRNSAEKMAKKLMKRMDKRLTKEKLAYIPMYLIEKQGEGVILFRGNDTTFRWALKNLFLALRNNILFLLRLNWVATLRYTLLLRQLRLIGLGGNSPYDYTQPCDDCIARCLLYVPCYTNEECWECRPQCPAPTDPNSYLSRTGCTCVASSKTCYCNFEAGVCAGAAPVKCASPKGQCEYTCNPGYVWNGVACVLAAVKLLRKVMGVGR